MAYNFLPDEVLSARFVLDWFIFLPFVVVVPCLNVAFAMTFSDDKKAILLVGKGYFGLVLFFFSTMDGGWILVFAPQLAANASRLRFQFYEMGAVGLGLQITGLLLVYLYLRQITRLEAGTVGVAQHGAAE